MPDAAELFARLTGELEDLHALATEGQERGLPSEASRIVVGQFGNGLQRLHALVDQIIGTLGDTE